MKQEDDLPWWPAATETDPYSNYWSAPYLSMDSHPGREELSKLVEVAQLHKLWHSSNEI